MSARCFLVVIVAALSLGTVVIDAGGWVVITLKNVPAHEWVGGGSVIYTVRQHGHTPMNDLTGRVEARKGPMVVRSTARELWGGRLDEIRAGGRGVRSPGGYVVDIPFPEPGMWTVDLTAGSGLVGDTLRMSVNVLPRGAAEPVVSAVERGRRLFEGKGCATCHKHPEFSSVRTVDVHDMTDRRYTSEHVQAFLLSLPSRTASIESFGTMPNLGLARHEVEALAAFLGR
jgi:hypothetical protein